MEPLPVRLISSDSFNDFLASLNTFHTLFSYAKRLLLLQEETLTAVKAGLRVNCYLKL